MRILDVFKQLVKFNWNRKMTHSGDLFENKYIMSSKDAIALIKKYFSEWMPEFRLRNEYITNTGQWGVEYVRNSEMLRIECDRGIFDWYLEIEGREIDLLGFDEQLSKIKASSQKNIQYVLEMYHRYLSSSW